jgi:hypothetical protein
MVESFQAMHARIAIPKERKKARLPATDKRLLNRQGVLLMTTLPTKSEVSADWVHTGFAEKKSAFKEVCGLQAIRRSPGIKASAICCAM